MAVKQTSSQPGAGPVSVEEAPATPALVGAGYHQPALDGLRGIAILLVMIFHAGVFGDFQPVTRPGIDANRLIASGWIGVDLFFVLSGFLITGILLRSRHKPNYFRNFYARRVLRIFPLYYAAVVVLVVAMHFVPPVKHGLTRAATIAATYTVNLAIGAQGWPAIPGPMQHFWTLAIEEQFYLAWPLLVYCLTRRRLVLACGAIMTLAPLFRWFYLSQHNWLAAFVLTWCRFDTLALGGLVALFALSQRPSARSKWTLGGVGALAAAGLITEFVRHQGLHFEDFAMATAGFSLVAWLSGAVIAGLTLWPHGWWQRCCTLAPLRFLGKYSYGLYVVHQPVMLGLRILRLNINSLRRFLPHELLAYCAFLVLALSCSMLVALCTWRLIEVPCLRLKRYFEYDAA